MFIENIEVGKHYIQTNAYSGRTWFEVKCLYKYKEEIRFEIIKPIPDNDFTRASNSVGNIIYLNKLECERYIIEKSNE